MDIKREEAFNPSAFVVQKILTNPTRKPDYKKGKVQIGEIRQDMVLEIAIWYSRKKRW